MGRLQHRTSKGCTYFVTTKTWENRAIFQAKDIAEILISCLTSYQEKDAFLLHEFVVMPNHLHLLLTPAADPSLEKAMQLIKGGASHQIHKVQENNSPIWHSSVHESTIRDLFDFRNRRRYIHMNPVEAHLIEHAADWPYSSASGRFKLDPMPEYLSSGAKAHLIREVVNVGAKAPTP